jgi:hypothetical protein
VRSLAYVHLASGSSDGSMQPAPPHAKTPQDLTLHNCINLRLPARDSLLPWELSKGRRELQVRVEGQLTFNNVYQMVEAALGGFGLAYVPKNLVEPHVLAGRLSWVLEDWFPTFVGYHVYYRSLVCNSRGSDRDVLTRHPVPTSSTISRVRFGSCWLRLMRRVHHLLSQCPVLRTECESFHHDPTALASPRAELTCRGLVSG